MSARMQTAGAPAPGSLQLRVWRAPPTPEERPGGTDICVSIDAETRGMHVQQSDDAGPIVIVGSSGDAAVRGMRRSDILIGVHHIPLPAQATLQHVQQLMESLPRPLSLNLYRPSAYDKGELFEGDEAKLDHPLPMVAKVWVPNPQPEGAAQVPGAEWEEGQYRSVGAASFFTKVVRAHKGFVLTELHHKEDPDSTRLERLVL